MRILRVLDVTKADGRWMVLGRRWWENNFLPQVGFCGNWIRENVYHSMWAVWTKWVIGP